VKLRLLAALALAVLLAPAARASVEEFSTYDLARMELNDENFLDHWLTRQPRSWYREFADAPNAFRTSQGCYTSGEWYMRHDLKARAEFGERAYMDIGLQIVSDDIASWQWLRLDFRWPTSGAGTFGFRFAPTADKSNQDFSALWDWGAPGDPLQIGAVFTVEDAFNSLWEFRQSQVGDHHEPYRAHPLEPALWVATEGKRHRVELGGKWLTPLSKDIVDPDTTQNGTYSLWGAKGALLAEFSFGAWATETRFETEQTQSSASTATVPGTGRTYCRRWLVEGAARRAIGEKWTAEARGAYQDRTEDWRPPPSIANMRALDRGVALEFAGDVRENWRLRVGAMHDRVGLAEQGEMPAFTWGTRTESRAYVGLEARFGRIRVQGIEGIELDQESYDVSFHHDKGFLQLQAVF